MTHTQDAKWFPHLTLTGYDPGPPPGRETKIEYNEWLLGQECYKYGEKPVAIIDHYSQSLKEVIWRAMDVDPQRYVWNHLHGWSRSRL